MYYTFKYASVFKGNARVWVSSITKKLQARKPTLAKKCHGVFREAQSLSLASHGDHSHGKKPVISRSKIAI